MVPLPVPVILERDADLPVHRLKKVADLRITVYLHPLCEQRMAVRVRRIMLRTVIFFDNGIGTEVKEQPHIFCRKISAKDLRELIVVYDLPYDDPRPYP